jgi:predicted GIY-YIG superfamily endonuclease
LKCESEKYYVGRTIDLRKRLEFHLFRENSRWTKTYKPIKIEEIVVSDDSLDEDKWVKKYMIKKGINHVRGGSYCTIDLNKWQIEAIVHEIVHSRGKCFYCLSDSHLVSV